jgi:hypothetical protein
MMKADDGHDELMARAKVIEDMMTDVFETVPDLQTQIRVGRRFIEAYPPLPKPVPPMPDPPSRREAKLRQVIRDLTGETGLERYEQSCPVPAPAPDPLPDNQLWIHAATYGHGIHIRDVSHVIRGLVSKARVRVLVSNGNMGGDPCRGKRKVLTVRYRTLYGTQGLLSVEAKEGTYLELPSLRAKVIK